VETGSLTRAAERCGITQSAVSHALHALESETRLSLLRRNRGGVRLTPEGEKLLPAVRRIVEALDGFSAEAAQLGRQEGCLIRIGAFASVAVHWLPRIIKDFQKTHPQADFRMLTGDYHDIAQWFEDGSIDVGFVTREMKLPGCTTIPLTEDRLLAVLPADHPLAGRERIAAGELRGENFISLMENSNQDARGVLEAAGVQVDVKYTAKDDYAIIAMVEAGLGVSIMPELLLKGHSDGVATVEIEGAGRRTIGLAVSSAGAGQPCVESFADFVGSWVLRREA
jgi:DNA-binding transcriptional LysR family regulator